MDGEHKKVNEKDEKIGDEKDNENEMREEGKARNRLKRSLYKKSYSEKCVII